MSTLRSGAHGLSTASCLTVLALILLGAFALITYLTGNFKAAEYLRILNVKGTGELTVFC